MGGVVLDASWQVSIFEGNRQPIEPQDRFLLMLRDGDQRRVHWDHHSQSSVVFTVPLKGNLADYYTVVASADSRSTTGFGPMLLKPRNQLTEIMLLPKRPKLEFNFRTLKSLRQSHSTLAHAFNSGLVDYDTLVTREKESLATILNVCGVFDETDSRNPLSHNLKIVDARQDRFFGLVDENFFAKIDKDNDDFEDVSPAHHVGSPCKSRKETRLPFGNVQFTFYLDRNQVPNDLNGHWQKGRIMIDADLDYYRGLSHILLEGVPHLFAGKTDPKVAYRLRWTACRSVRKPIGFNPLYTCIGTHRNSMCPQHPSLESGCNAVQ